MFKKIFFSLLVLGFAISIPMSVLAAPSFLVSDDKDSAISINNPINDDVYIAGGSVVINEDIRGDLFVAGGTIDINANISGDLFVAGGNISIRGSVGDDIRIGGGNINIYGQIGDDLIVGGGTVMVADTAVIKGDLLVGTGDFNLYGKVFGNLKAGFGNARIGGVINGDADLRYEDGQLNFTDNAKIGGKLDYWSVKEDESFKNVATSIEYHKFTALRNGKDFSKFALFAPVAMFAGVAWSFIGILLLGGLLLLLMPKWLPKVVNIAKKDYWAALWQGILFAIVVPVLAFAIALTGFGIPVSLVMMLSFFVLMLLASVPISMTIGSYILKYKEEEKAKQFGALAIGAFIYIALGLLPIIGWLLKLILFIIGIGVIWLYSADMIKKGNY